MASSSFKLITFLAAAGVSLGAHASTVFSANFDDATLDGGATAYQLVSPGQSTTPGQYNIIKDPAVDFNNPYSDYGDHTTGHGYMLFVDGAGNGENVWSESAALAAGSYTFTFYGSSAYVEQTPSFQLSIDGVDTPTALATTAGGAWHEYSYTFDVLASTTYQFSIYDANLTTSLPGNDGGIDDISLVTAVPEASSALMMLAGLGALAGLARRRAARK